MLTAYIKWRTELNVTGNVGKQVLNTAESVVTLLAN